MKKLNYLVWLRNGAPEKYFVSKKSGKRPVCFKFVILNRHCAAAAADIFWRFHEGRQELFYSNSPNQLSYPRQPNMPLKSTKQSRKPCRLSSQMIKICCLLGCQPSEVEIWRSLLGTITYPLFNGSLKVGKMIFLFPFGGIFQMEGMLLNNSTAQSWGYAIWSAIWGIGSACEYPWRKFGMNFLGAFRVFFGNIHQFCDDAKPMKWYFALAIF